ncbi:MAG: hypothetical protein ACK56F_03745, partial [bacterium]
PRAHHLRGDGGGEGRGIQVRQRSGMAGVVSPLHHLLQIRQEPVGGEPLLRWGGIQARQGGGQGAAGSGGGQPVAEVAGGLLQECRQGGFGRWHGPERIEKRGHQELIARGAAANRRPGGFRRGLRTPGWGETGQRRLRDRGILPADGG